MNPTNPPFAEAMPAPSAAEPAPQPQPENPEPLRITALTEIDALVGEHVTGEIPFTHWEDSHAVFSFETEEEALDAIRNPYYQLFLPDVDWSETIVRKVKTYRPYSSDLLAAWEVVEKLSAAGEAVQFRKEQGKWLVSIGSKAAAMARTPPLAICLAALCGKRVPCQLDLDALI